MRSAIGMSVPGASDLGLGLTQQAADETEEEKRRRLLAAQQNRLLPSLAAGPSSLGLNLTGYGAGVSGGI